MRPHAWESVSPSSVMEAVGVITQGSWPSESRNADRSVNQQHSPVLLIILQTLQQPVFPER